MTTTEKKGPETARVTGKPGSNSSTISGRHNPNKPEPEGGMSAPDKTSPGTGVVHTKPGFKGKPVR